VGAPVQRLARAGLLAAALLGLTACPHQVALSPTTIWPGAKGRAALSRDGRSRVVAEVSVARLAPPNRLSPPFRCYVVWAEPPRKPAINEGLLRIDEKLQGKLRFTIFAQRFDIFITAENNPRARAPAGPEILRTNVNPI